MYRATVIADSTAMGVRLTTFEVVFPRFTLAEWNTHRMMSRNSASSRAIPVPRRIEQALDRPFVPESYSKNKSGMQGGEALSAEAAFACRDSWLRARDACIAEAKVHLDHEAHKQHANRLIELWAWHTVVATGTEWANFFALRDHHHAQPEIQLTARLMKEALAASEPRPLVAGEWHLPYLDQSEASRTMQLGHLRELLAASVARCAAISFERQNVEKAVAEYIARHDGLLTSGHMSPFEHQAMATDDANAPPFAPHYRFEPDDDENSRLFTFGRRGRWVEDGWFCGNLRAPFLAYRKTIPGEAVFGSHK